MDFDCLPTAIDAHPDAARQLGRMVSAWSIVEVLVTALFARVINDQGPLAAAILHQFQHIHHRLEVINDVIDETVADPNKRARLKALTGEVRRLSKERNRLVHGIWGLSKRTSSLVLIEGTTAKKKRIERPISEHEIEKLVRELVDLNARLRSEIFPAGSQPIDLRRVVRPASQP